MNKILIIALLLLSIAFFIEALNNTPGILENAVQEFHIEQELIDNFQQLWKETK